MFKSFAIMLTCMSLTLSCVAQSALESISSVERSPIEGHLFRLSPEQHNHHFEVPLPNNGTLQIDFLRLSDWGEKNELNSVTQAAALQVRMLADSFRTDYSIKVIEMNIPIDKQVVALNYQELEGAKRQLAFKDGAYYALKTGFDTVRVVRNVGIRTKPLIDSGLVQIQYTYILKDVHDLEQLAGNTAEVERLGAQVDEIIEKYRNKWSKPDGRTMQLQARYDPEKEKMIRTNVANSGIFGPMGLYIAMGAITYTNNTISPYLEETVAYLIPSRSKMQPFVGFNLSGFGFFNTNGQKGNANYISYNVEYGFCKKGSSFMQQKTSFMVGVMRMNTLKPDNTGTERNFLFHMGFTFGVSSSISAGFSTATDYKKNSPNGLMGINFKFNL